MLSYTFYAFNGPLIRFFEGYQWRNSGFFQWRERIQKNAFKKLQGYLEEQRKLHRQCIEDHKIRGSDPMAFTPEMQKRWEECEESRFDWAKAERRFDLEYPAEPDRVLPTRLGNTMVAFEDYPRTRYGIDAIALWSRLVPLLGQNEYLDFVNREFCI